MFDLLRTIRYNGSKVYQQYCPMAFNNAGAAWLSNSTEIVNPYFGEKMLHCGDLRDSVNIAK
jgi:Cu(I)/Ag(I) efflux system membrane fusion protein